LDGLLGVPLAYVSGSALSSSMEFANQTFASIGLRPGTYIWTWGQGRNADNLTVQIGPAAVSEPASMLMVGIGLLALAAVRQRRGKIGTQTRPAQATATRQTMSISPRPLPCPPMSFRSVDF